MFTRFLFKPHKYIKVILAILLSVIVITSFSSCAIKNNSEQNHLVYYTLNDEDSLSWIIEKYNKYCINSNNPSFQIEVVKFNSEQEMSTQISTEIMAGSGPDIISLSQKLPFEKLIESNSLMNIYDLLKDDNSSNAINLDDYNANILNAGVFDDSLYIVPLFYGVDVLVSTEDRLNDFDIKENNGFSLTYSNFSDVFKNYFANDKGYSFVSNELSDFWWFDYPMQLFCRFLNSYVDFENKAVYFDTDEFKDNLDAMTQMLKISQKTIQMNCLTDCI